MGSLNIYRVAYEEGCIFAGQLLTQHIMHSVSNQYDSADSVKSSIQLGSRDSAQGPSEVSQIRGDRID